MLSLISCIALAVGLSACGGDKDGKERHKHNYIEEVTAPTCTAKGFSNYTCECGSSYTADYVDPLDHDFEGDTCKRCGYIIHDHVYTKTTVEPDCNNGGYTKGVCDVCGATYRVDFKDPLGHNYENGICTRCGQRDPDKHFHKYVREAVEPDCENGGYTVFICECGDSYKDNYVNPLGHDYIHGKCTRCDDVLGTEGLEYTLSDDGEYYICTGIGTATETEIVIASEYNGKKVMVIGEHAFDNRYRLKSIIIPDSVTQIGKMAFYACDELTDVSIPDSVVKIGDSAFEWCPKLRSITIGSGVKEIGERIFAPYDKDMDIYYNGTMAEWVAIKKDEKWDSPMRHYIIHCTDGDFVVWELEYALSFSGDYYICTGIGKATAEDIVIKSECNGKPVKAIGDKAFYKCYGLKSIIIPDSVTAIGNSAFEDCFDLTEVQVPDTVTSIGRYAFAYCVSLTSINIPDGIGIISEGAYRQCSSVTSITIPDSVTQIGKMAFYACAGLTSVTVPDSVVKIGDSAFGYCRNLQSITIGSGVKEIGKSIFEEYDKVTDIYYKGTRVEWVAIKKDEEWDGPLSHYIIHCTDGEIICDKQPIY